MGHRRRSRQSDPRPPQDRLRIPPARAIRRRRPRQRTKSGRARSVPLTRRAQEAAEFMLCSPHHGQVDANWLGRRWRTVMDKLDLRDVTIHTLRHTCASRLVQRGVDLYVVCRWLGHSSVEITRRYAHLSTENLKPAMAVLEDGDAPKSAPELVEAMARGASPEEILQIAQRLVDASPAAPARPALKIVK